jgi:alpha/beta superfamily hydrolase
MAYPSQVRSLDDLLGPVGRLEAILNTGTPDAPYAALIAHPHPVFGGTMHNKVVYNTMKAFSHFGLPVLRFNFRGAGLSEGTHDDGRGEVEDVRAALEYLIRLTDLPILFAGFSFGSHVGLRACCGDPRVKGLVGLGLPVRAAHRDYRYDFLPNCTAPKLFVSGDQDEFCPAEVLAEVLTQAPEPKTVALIEGADHFFQGVPTSPKPKLDLLQQHLHTWLAETFQLSEPDEDR